MLGLNFKPNSSTNIKEGEERENRGIEASGNESHKKGVVGVGVGVGVGYHIKY